MAKVVISVDTEAATITASVNGKTVDADIKYISVQKIVDMYSKNKTPEVDVSISSYEEEDGIKTLKHICCEQSEAGKLAATLCAAKADYEGFINNPVTPNDILDFKSTGASIRDALMKNLKG